MDYRDQTPMTFSAREQVASVDQGLRSFMLGVYNYMASALALTGIMAYLGATNETLRGALYNMDGLHPGLTPLGWVVFFAPFAFILFGFNRVQNMSLGAAQAVYWAFSAVMGLSLSSIFFVYTGESIVRVFFITAILFGSMSMWGYATKRDLTSMGHFMMMGLWGVILASLVNLFLHSSALQFAVSIVGVAVFTGLTAFDTQKIKALYYQVAGNADAAGKTAILGALNLYLDFLNMFLMLLRLFGNRR